VGMAVRAKWVQLSARWRTCSTGVFKMAVSRIVDNAVFIIRFRLSMRLNGYLLS
jgi:hypothetical protein